MQSTWLKRRQSGKLKLLISSTLHWASLCKARQLSVLTVRRLRQRPPCRVDEDFHHEKISTFCYCHSWIGRDQCSSAKPDSRAEWYHLSNHREQHLWLRWFHVSENQQYDLRLRWQ